MRILYAEDSEFDADLTQRALRRSDSGLEIEIVPTLKDARQRLAGAGVDLLLTDLKLPDGSGLELLAHIREHALPVAVVVLTGSGDGSSAIAALKAGADDYLIKSGLYLERLPRVLDAALLRHRSMSARCDRPIRVLCAESSLADVELMRGHLLRHAPQIRLESTGSVDAVINRLPAGPDVEATFDVLLIDALPDETTGLDLVKLIRSERQLSLPIVMLAGQDSEQLASSALHLGVDDYLVKHPGYLFELPATLEKVHRRAELVLESERLNATNQRMSQLLAASPTVVYSLRLQDGEFQSS
ncbi:MAG: response regulator, partial [Methyloversatilis sp.]